MQRENPPFGGLLGVPPEKIKRVFISPGPIYDSFGGESYSRLAKIFYAAGFREHDVVLNTFSYHLVPAGLIMDEVLGIIGAMVLPTGVGNTELQVQIMKDLKVTGYVGTPSFLMTLITKAENLGYDFRRDFSMKTAFLAAEMLPQSLRDTFQNDYGINNSQAYGIADLGLLAYECSEKSGMHIPEEVIIEIVDPDTGKQLGPGEIGEVLVTPIEETHPLIRFSTGDLSLYTDEPCPCGRTSSRLVRIAGRVGESVKVRGMFVHPRELEGALSKFSQVANYQAIVNRVGVRDDLTLKLELAGGDVDKQKLSEDVLRSVSAACRVKFDRVEFVSAGRVPKDRKAILDERTWD
ncbi:MAG: AMP-binding protein [Chloroflexi bacterium CG07_land_8_20_14_0_80_51_10]|nr:MAG: AMP-binding protein [Chloroflexi bacterium CG07_land_8_20_14_0_80_51_10]